MNELNRRPLKQDKVTKCETRVAAFGQDFRPSAIWNACVKLKRLNPPKSLDATKCCNIYSPVREDGRGGRFFTRERQTASLPNGGCKKRWNKGILRDKGEGGGGRADG